MTSKQLAMRPTGMPLESVLDRATGPRRAEVDELLALHREVSGYEPVVWADRIVGFGEYTYLYESGHGGNAPLLAFAPGAARHTIYLSNDFDVRWPDLMENLGRYRANKACLYLTRLSGVDVDVLRMLLERSLAESLAQARDA